MNHSVKILNMEPLNHNVIRFQLEKPPGYSFEAGQAIELMIAEPEKRGPSPFTFTSLNTTRYLELTIKIYKERDGLTSALARKHVGDTVSISDPWDSFLNKGPGVFIAGGAGITPFIALLRQLKADGNIGNSSLFFSNKTRKDIFMEGELRSLVGDRYYNILTEDAGESNAGRLDAHYLKEHIVNLEQPFYLCGPPGFAESLQDAITTLGAKQDLVNVSF
jgi:ferredoxin-NADP reductase